MCSSTVDGSCSTAIDAPVGMGSDFTQDLPVALLMFRPQCSILAGSRCKTG